MVGAGSFGAWTALHLVRHGRRVALVEAHAPGHTRSSSGGESRIIRMGYGANEVYTRWSKHALDLWLDLFARTGRALFEKTGVLWLARDREPYVSESLEAFERLNIPHEVLSRLDLARRYPRLSLDSSFTRGLLEPESGVLMARRAVQTVTEQAVREGVQYLCAEVVSIEDAIAMVPPSIHSTPPRDRLERVVTTSGQSLELGPDGAAVFACGPWLPRVFPSLLGDRIFNTRQEVFFFGIPPGISGFAPPALPTWIDLENEAYGMPELDGRGLKCAIDSHGPPFDPDRGDRLPTPENLQRVRQYVSRRFPALTDAPLLESRVCQYENTSSGDLLLDRYPGFQNVWIAGGGSGHGFKHGPSVGEYLADRILNNAPADTRFSLETKLTMQSRALF